MQGGDHHHLHRTNNMEGDDTKHHHRSSSSSGNMEEMSMQEKNACMQSMHQQIGAHLPRGQYLSTISTTYLAATVAPSLDNQPS